MTDVPSTTWVQFTATVPDWGVSAMSRLAASLAERSARGERSAPVEPSQAPTGSETADPSAEALVRRVFREIRYPGWRAFLAVLAAESLTSEDGWVDWRTLHTTLDTDPQKLSGVLGVAQKVLSGRPPFERGRRHGQAAFRMTPAVAREVLRQGDEEREEGEGR